MDKHAPTSISPDEFRTGMRALAAAVNVVTALKDGRRYGMTATAVSSVSAEPPTLLVCVDRKTATHDAIEASEAFCVNALRAEHIDISRAFSGPQAREVRFDNGEWTQLSTGSPRLADAVVSFDCRVVRKISHGTHTIFLGNIEAVAAGDRLRPLLFSDGRYGALTWVADRVAHGEEPDSLLVWGLD